MDRTALQLAQRFAGVKETPGAVHNPMILAMLQLDDINAREDEIPWCSAFVNFIAFLYELPRSRSLRARSWLTVGQPISLLDAKPGYDVVILSRGAAPAPANVMQGPGHVGFFVALIGQPTKVRLFGGNQNNRVGMADFDADRVLGVRRLA